MSRSLSNAAIRVVITAVSYLAGRRRRPWWTVRPTLERLGARDLPSAYTMPVIDFGPYIAAGENPNNGAGQITTAELAERLTAVARYADGVRTFDCTGDLKPASGIIRSLGKAAIIGAWLQDYDPARPERDAQTDALNQAAVDELIAQARAGLVDVAIVGSETLQRGRFPEAKLLGYLDQVKTALAGLNVPVTTADTYPALVQHPNVLAAIDSVVFANFYPFWEGQPVEAAVASLHQQYRTLKAMVGSKEVFVSETGWPSAGAAVGSAVPSPENAAAYALNFVSWARANTVRYAYFEGIDEPFKVVQEGTAGPHWGLLSGDLTLKPGMQPIFDGATVPDNWSAVDFATMPAQVTTNLPAFVLSGSTAPGDTVAVNGTPIPASEIDSSGAYAHVVPLSAGTNTLTVTVRDAGGTLVSTTTKAVVYDPAYSTAGRGLLYVDAASPALDGTVVIDPANRLILGIITGKHVRGVSADGRFLYTDDRSVISKATHAVVRTLPFTQPIPANGFLVSPKGDLLFSRTEVADVATNALVAPLPADITTGNSFGGAPVPGGPAITPDGATIFAGGAVTRIDVATRTASPTGITHPAFLSDLAVSPDGRWLVVSAYAGGGQAAVYDAGTFAPKGAIGLGDFAGKVGFIGPALAVVGSAGNPANGGGGLTVIDLTGPTRLQAVSVPLADNVAATGTGDVVFAASGTGPGVEARAVAADGTLRQSTTYDLGINRYVRGSGAPADDQIRGLYFSPAPVQSITRTTPLGPGTNAGSVTFTVTFGEPVTGVDPTDFRLALTGVTAGPVAVAGTGAAYTVTVGGIAGAGTLGLNLADDDSVRDGGGNPLGGAGAGNADFAGPVYVVDRAAPTAGAVSDGPGADVDLQASPTTITANWSGFADAGSGIAYYEWAVGTSAGAADVRPFTAVGTATAATATGLSLADGVRYYVTVRAVDNLGNVGAAAVSNGVVVDATPPAGGRVDDGPGADVDYQTSTTTLSANWSGFADSGSGIAGYQWAVGTSPGGTDVRPFTAVGLATTATNAGLALAGGTRYYTTVRAVDRAGNVGPSVTSDGVLVDVAPPTGGVVTDGPGADLAYQQSTTTLSASWSGFVDAGSGVAAYYWAIGTTRGGTDVRPFTAVGTAATATATGLSLSSGTTYYVSVRAADALGNTGGAVSSDGVTVDADRPTSAVAALPPVSTAAALTVSWSGADGPAGSGVAVYDVYVSTDGGPFTPLLAGTSLPGTTFTGVTGHRYGFYAVATDRAGNTQLPPAAAQATTLVDTDPPAAAVSPLPAYTTSVAFTVTWGGTDGPSGSGVVSYRVFVSTDGGAYSLWQQAAAPGSATFTGQPGRRYAFYAIATDAAGNTQAAPASAQAATLVDTTAPASGVGPLPAVQPAAPFLLTWAGGDGPGGSGVAFYDVYVSTDGGPYRPFVSNTAATNATFAGAPGHNYAFYSVATDRAGLREDAPGTPDATTTVLTSQPPRTEPSPVLVGSREFAVGAGGGTSATVRAFNPDGSERSARTAFDGGGAGGVRTAVADYTGDGVTDVAAGTGPGTPARLRVWDGATGQVILDVPFFEGFPGGLFVAAGDLTRDGKAELVVTPDQGGGPRVTVLGGGDFATLANFFGIDDANFRGGARAGLGDITGDGSADLVVSAGFGGGPRLSVYDGAALAGGRRVHLVGDFFLFEPALRNGAYVAVGDVDGDGMADVIGGAGPGGGPRVLTVSGRTLLAAGAGAALAVPITNFFAGNVDNRGGVRVAAKNLDGDAKADLVVGDGEGGGSRVTGYAGKDFAGGSAPELFGFDAFAGLTDGVFVG